MYITYTASAIVSVFIPQIAELVFGRGVQVEGVHDDHVVIYAIQFESLMKKY